MSGISYAEWLSSGERALVGLPDRKAASAATFGIFCRLSGNSNGPWLTLLHGFPTCSWDYAKVLPALEARFRVLAFDFLGFGDSDKPRKHRYSIHEQTDLAEAVWRHFDVRETWIVAHDYAVSVAQELLARPAEAPGNVHIRGVTFLNGGVYPDLARPLRIQRLLRSPLVGAILSRLSNERMFHRNLSSVFSPQHRLRSEELAQHWIAIARRGGRGLAHRLIAYMDDRDRHCQRWSSALEKTRVPLHFVWGLLDPVSGAHMLARVHSRLPNARVVELADVGHYPQLEAPERVVAEIERMVAG